jgi:hypothetical protein
VVIGDRDSDIELGRRLGATTIRLVPRPAVAGIDKATSATLTSHPITVPSDHQATDLLQAADIIERLPPPRRAL